jgi:hypothetical protein
MQRLLRPTTTVLRMGTPLLYPLLAPPPHRIDEAHFQLIAEGMTEAEVEAIFGVPAGSYDSARPKTEYGTCGSGVLTTSSRHAASQRKAVAVDGHKPERTHACSRGSVAAPIVVD